MTTYMTLQKESLFRREDTRRWQTCFTAVLQDRSSGCGFWTMAVLDNAHTSRETTARERWIHLPAVGQNSQSSLKRPEGWSVVLDKPPLKLIPLAAPPLPSSPVKILAMPSPHFSHPLLHIHLFFSSHSHLSNSAPLSAFSQMCRGG